MNDTIVQINDGNDFEVVPDGMIDPHGDNVIDLRYKYGEPILMGHVGSGKTAFIAHAVLSHIPILVACIEQSARNEERVLRDKHLDALLISADNILAERGIGINNQFKPEPIAYKARPPLPTIETYFNKPTCSPREWGQKKMKRKHR